jgi:hypothetical protein
MQMKLNPEQPPATIQQGTSDHTVPPSSDSFSDEDLKIHCLLVDEDSHLIWTGSGLISRDEWQASLDARDPSDPPVF